MLTPIDQPMSTARSTPKWSITDEGVLDERLDADAVGVGRPVGAAGAAVVPGDDPDAAVGAQQRRPGPGVGARGRCTAARWARRCVPSGSLVQARSRVPSSESTSWYAIAVAVAARAAEADMRPIVPQRGVGPEPWLSSPGGPGRSAARCAQPWRSLRPRPPVPGVPPQGGEELLDVVELRTPLCEGGGGDQGVAAGPLLGLDRPTGDGGDEPVSERTSDARRRTWC